MSADVADGQPGAWHGASDAAEPVVPQPAHWCATTRRHGQSTLAVTTGSVLPGRRAQLGTGAAARYRRATVGVGWQAGSLAWVTGRCQHDWRWPVMAGASTNAGAASGP